MSQDAMLRLEALRLALQLKEPETHGASHMIGSGYVVPGKSAEKLIADATKIHAFINAPKQIRKRK